MIDIVLAVMILIIAVVLLTFALAGISAAPWVPLWRSDIRRLLKLAELKEDELIYDLGSGDGRILIMAALENKAKPLGFEISVLPYFVSYITILIANLKTKHKIKVKFQSFYTADLSQADVVTIFLTPMAMRKLRQKLKTNLKVGCRVVSYAFPLPDWLPDAVDKPNQNKMSIYLYRVKHE